MTTPFAGNSSPKLPAPSKGPVDPILYFEFIKMESPAFSCICFDLSDRLRIMHGNRINDELTRILQSHDALLFSHLERLGIIFLAHRH